MKKYIICIGSRQDYFSGKTYMFQKEPYAALVDIDNAKRYKTLKLAERAAEKLWHRTINCNSHPVIVEVEE